MEMEKKLFVTDLEGKKIEITNLKDAIEQVSSFTHMTHNNPEFTELDKKLHTYWNDLHTKLLQLQN